MTVLIIDMYNAWLKYHFINKDKGYIDPAVYGCTQLLSLIYRNIEDYSNIYVVLDSDEGSKDKKELYPEYKKGRSDKKEAFKNFDDFLGIISKLPKLSIISNKYREADDIISYIAQNKCRKEKVIIYSSDKDFAQLVSLHENIKWATNFKDGKFLELSHEEILSKFKDSKKEKLTNKLGEITKWRIFNGDPSDGINAPIKGLSTKDKRKIIALWYEDYLNMDILGDIIVRLDDFDLNLRFKIAENFDQVLINYKLVSLKECSKDFKLKKFTKCVKVSISKEEYLKLLDSYSLDSRFRLLVGC